MHKTQLIDGANNPRSDEIIGVAGDNVEFQEIEEIEEMDDEEDPDLGVAGDIKRKKNSLKKGGEVETLDAS
jgi:hypothetical protein